MTYHVRVQGELGPEWADWFGGLAISREDAGVTLLTCEVADQAALHGLLRRLQDLGLPLLSIIRLEPGQAEAPGANRVIEANTTKERTNMNTKSGSSRALGVAFLIQAIASLANGMLMKLALIVPGNIGRSMVNVANRPWLMRTSILGTMITAAGIIFLGVMLFVVLRKQNEGMARVGQGFITLEGTLLAVSSIARFAFLRISQEYVAGGRPAFLETMGAVALDSMNFGSTLHMVAFGLGAIPLYWLLYRSRVIPRLVSLWGFATAVVVLGATIATVFGCEVPFAVYLPYAPFEFFVGSWILASGLSEKAKTGC